MINYVPQASGLGADGSPDAALVQAMAARKKAQLQGLSGGQQLMAKASSSEPIYNKGLGYAKLIAGGLGGFLEGNAQRTAQEKEQALAKQGAQSLGAMARTVGLREDQVAPMIGLAMSRPEMIPVLMKQLGERVFAKPEAKQWVKTGTDLLGRDTHGPFDPGTGTVGGGGAARAPSGGALAPAQSQAPSQPPAAADPRRVEFTRGGYPENAPLPPPGVNPKTFYDEWSKSQAASVLPAGAEATAKVRSEIQQLPSYKNLSQAAPIYTAMFDAASKNTKASDLNLVYGLGKIMDPGSVVREGEMLMVKNTSGLTEGILGAINSLNGGAALTPDTRIALMREAKGRLDAYKQSFEQDMQQYQGIAEKNRMDPTQVIPQFPGAVEFDRAGPPIPPGFKPPGATPPPEAVSAPTPAPVPGGLTVDMIEAELQRRQALQQQAQPAPYTDPMGATY